MFQVVSKFQPARRRVQLDMDMPRMDQLQLDKPLRLDLLQLQLASTARLPLFQNQMIVRCEAAQLGERSGDVAGAMEGVEQSQARLSSSTLFPQWCTHPRSH